MDAKTADRRANAITATPALDTIRYKFTYFYDPETVHWTIFYGLFRLITFNQQRGSPLETAYWMFNVDICIVKVVIRTLLHSLLRFECAPIKADHTETTMA